MTNGRPNPSPRELLIFSALWVVFCSLLGLVAAHRPASLLGAGVFTLVAAGAALLLDRETPIRRGVLGLVIPGALLACWGVIAGAGRAGIDPGYARLGVLVALVGVGVVGTAAMLVSPALARRVRRFWMDAGEPIGWTVATALLAVIYFAVFTPIGLVLRAFGHDPMSRGFDRGRASYWVDRPGAPEARRYFRQF